MADQINRLVFLRGEWRSHKNTSKNNVFKWIFSN